MTATAIPPPITLPIQLEPGARLPAHACAGDAGFDLCASLSTPHTLWPGARLAIPTGLRAAVPAGWELQIRSRAHLALDDGLVVVNAPGVIRAGDTGEIRVILANLDGRRPRTIQPGQRIAQAVLAPVGRVRLQPVEQLPDGAPRDSGCGPAGA